MSSTTGRVKEHTRAFVSHCILFEIKFYYKIVCTDNYWEALTIWQHKVKQTIWNRYRNMCRQLLTLNTCKTFLWIETVPFINREEVMRKRSPTGCRFQSEKKEPFIWYTYTYSINLYRSLLFSDLTWNEQKKSSNP